MSGEIREMLWNISLTSSKAAIINDEDANWVATFKDVATAEAVVAAHNCLQQRNATTVSVEEAVEVFSTVPPQVFNVGTWSRSASW